MARNLTIVITLALLMLAAGCTNKPAFELSPRWYRLSDVNKELVWLHPCDAAAAEIQLSNNRTELVIEWGQEEEVFQLATIEAQANGYALQATVAPGNNTTITATLVDADRRLVRWTWTDAHTTHELLMTDSAGLMHFKTVRQPCSECWGEEECARRETVATLTGIWQNTPSVAAGWTDAYQFFADGEFTFHYNQMVCDKRILSYSGRWEVTETGALALAIDSQTVVEGGELVPATGSCSSEYEIEGGEVKTIEHPEDQIVQLSAITTDQANMNRLVLMLNGLSFWKMNDDPSTY